MLQRSTQVGFPIQAIYGINKAQFLFMLQCISIYKDTHV